MLIGDIQMILANVINSAAYKAMFSDKLSSIQMNLGIDDHNPMKIIAGTTEVYPLAGGDPTEPLQIYSYNPENEKVASLLIHLTVPTDTDEDSEYTLTAEFEDVKEFEGDEAPTVGLKRKHAEANIFNTVEQFVYEQAEAFFATLAQKYSRY